MMAFSIASTKPQNPAECCTKYTASLHPVLFDMPGKLLGAPAEAKLYISPSYYNYEYKSIWFTPI